MSRIDFVTGAPEKYAHLVDRLAEAPVRLRSITRGQNQTALRRDPGNGEWPISRILAHMAVMAQRNGLFIYQMATMTDPARAPLDEDTEAGRLQHQNPLMLVDLIEAELGKTIALLSHTPDASWGRPGRKNGLRRSLRQEVETHGSHMHEHLDAVEALLKS